MVTDHCFWPLVSFHTPKKETHRFNNAEYQLEDLRPILIFFCWSLKTLLLAPDGELTAEPT